MRCTVTLMDCIEVMAGLQVQFHVATDTQLPYKTNGKQLCNSKKVFSLGKVAQEGGITA